MRSIIFPAGWHMKSSNVDVMWWIQVAELFGLRIHLITCHSESWQSASALLWWWWLIKTIFTYLWLFRSCEWFFCMCMKRGGGCGTLFLWISLRKSRSETPSSAILSRVNSEGCCLVNPLELVVEIYSIYTPTQTLVARRHTPAGHARRYPHLAPLRICHIYIVFTRLPVSVLIIFSHGRMWNSVFMHLLE